MKLKKKMFLLLLGFSLLVWGGAGYTQNMESPKKLRVGRVHQGGVIVYLNGSSGLIAAPEIQGFDAPWTSESYEARVRELGHPIPTGARGTQIGAGNTNTALIVATMGSGNYAAKICQDLDLNGYSDWFLPSKDELNMLFKNSKAFSDGVFNFWGYVVHNQEAYLKGSKGIGKHSATYWTSTEDPDKEISELFDVWLQSADNEPIAIPISEKANVRCFRSF
ncbi:MAG: hypothetical protein LBE62_09980 [Azonexus sp.]|jgi:hypothetical protein|nr:hypothetical protein [Azonexus sp.]